MTWTTDGHDGAGIVERDFAVHSASSGEQVPGVYRRSADGEHDRLVLLGHGGTSDRKADYIVHLARLLAERGIATMAIDGPGHGERATFEFKRTSDDFDVAWNGGEGPMGCSATGVRHSTSSSPSSANGPQAGGGSRWAR